MKIDIIRGEATMNYLIKKIKIPCENPHPWRKCDMYYFLHLLLEFFYFNDISFKEKKRRIEELNEKIENDIELFSVKYFVEYFDMLHY